MKKKSLAKRAARGRVIRRDPFTQLTLAVVAYLDTIGWSALVVGNPRIQQQPGARTFNYEFVVTFTGDRKAPAPTEKRDAVRR